MTKKTRTKLLDSTLSLIDQKSFQQISTKEIAKESGVAEVTLFRHFKNKESLFDNLAEKFFKMMVGFETININNEEEFRIELIKYFTKTIKSNPLQRKLFKVLLHIGMYKKNTFFKYVIVYEEQIAGPIEQIVEYGKEHWGYRKGINTDIAVRLLINSLGFFNIIQNVFLLREVKSYNFDQIIEIGVDSFLRSLKE
jgi:AcrR family transcriptional regulator